MVFGFYEYWGFKGTSSWTASSSVPSSATERSSTGQLGRVDSDLSVCVE